MHYVSIYRGPDDKGRSGFLTYDDEARSGQAFFTNVEEYIARLGVPVTRISEAELTILLDRISPDRFTRRT
jgi:hypothetical protein